MFAEEEMVERILSWQRMELDLVARQVDVGANQAVAPQGAQERGRNHFPNSKLVWLGSAFRRPQIGANSASLGPRNADPSHIQEVIAAPSLNYFLPLPLETIVGGGP